MPALPHSTTNALPRSTENRLFLSATNTLLRSTTNTLLRSTANTLLSLLIAGLCLPIATVARAMSEPADASGDDIFLIQASVSPNVVLFLDNSQSMNAIEWHPAFDPEAAPYG